MQRWQLQWESQFTWSSVLVHQSFNSFLIKLKCVLTYGALSAISKYGPSIIYSGSCFRIPKVPTHLKRAFSLWTESTDVSLRIAYRASWRLIFLRRLFRELFSAKKISPFLRNKWPVPSDSKLPKIFKIYKNIVEKLLRNAKRMIVFEDKYKDISFLFIDLLL